MLAALPAARAMMFATGVHGENALRSARPVAAVVLTIRLATADPFTLTPAMIWPGLR